MKLYFSGSEIKYFFISVKTKNNEMIFGKSVSKIYMYSTKINKNYFFFFESLFESSALRSRII